jgi:hypothetical protein
MAGGNVRPSLRRWRAAVGAVVVASALALSGAGPAAAAVAAVPVGGGGGGDGGGSNPCAEVSGSFTALPPSTMFFGVSYQVSWTTQRPTGCSSNISTMLIGPGSPGTLHVSSGGGTETVTLPLTVQGPATYRIAAFWPGGSVTVASVTVSVGQGPLVRIQSQDAAAHSCMSAFTTVVGAPVILENCDGSTGQAFRFWPVAGLAGGFIVTTSQGYCLALSPDTLVSQFQCPTTVDPSFVWYTGAFFAPYSDTQFMSNEGLFGGGCLTSVEGLPWGTLVGAATAQLYGLDSSTIGFVLQECNFLNQGQPWIQVPRT